MALSVLLTATQSAAQGTAVEVSPYPPVRPFDGNAVDPEHESGDEIDDPADVAQAAEVPEDCLAALDARGVDLKSSHPSAITRTMPAGSRRRSRSGTSVPD